MRRQTVFLAIGLFAAVASAQDGGAGSTEAELRVLRAWFTLEDSNARADCEKVFRAALADEALAEDLRIRAAIGMGRIDRLDGRPVDARKRLEALIPRTADRPLLRRILLEQLGPPRWFSGVRVVPGASGWFLDLDNGGMTKARERGPNGGPEMEGARFLVPTVEDRGIAEALPRMSAKPWHRLRTDEGNLCLVQVLATSPQAVVRFVTRLGGFGDIGTMPAPERPFCIGYNSKIEVWWHPDPRYVRYRVQRRLGPLAAWERSQEFEAPPFIDRKVDAGRRYGYRVIGITKEGYEGLPALLQGTVRSRGVTRGQIEVEQNRRVQFDLMLGESVNRGWDINIQNVWQQGAMIQNYYGSNIFAMVRTPDNREPLSPWDVTVSNQYQLKSGDRFLVPLFGGGVARCRIQIAQRKNGRWGGTIDYEVYGDGDIFPEPPRLTTRETENGIELHAETEEPFRITEVVVKELVSRSGPWSIEIDAKGNGIDKDAKTDEIREYSVVGVDPHGRRTLAGHATVVLKQDKPEAGEFKIRYQQGFSFERGAIVNLAESDLYFQQGNRGLERMFFQVPRGVRNLKGAHNWKTSSIDDVQIFDRIAGLENADENLPATQIWARKGTPGESVLILRTRHGGWVKMVITDRGKKSGNWTQTLATVRYVYNPRSPRFDDAPDDITVRGGIRFSGLKDIEARAKVISEWSSSWKTLWRDGAFRRHMSKIAPAGGGVADADDAQEVLLEQTFHKNLTTARFSFSLGRRDPVEGNLLASIWDIRWQNEHFHARLSGNDKSTVTDLGRTYWTRLLRPAHVLPWSDDSARVRMGHMYLLRKVTGAAYGPPTLFRVIGLEPWKRLQIEWATLRDGKLKTSPGLELDAATRARLRGLLAGLWTDPKQAPKATQEALGGEQAFRTYSKMHSERIASVARRDVKLAEFVEELTLVTGLKFVLEGDVGTRKVSLLRNGTTAHSLVMDMGDSADLTWRIDEEGRIHMRPRVLSGVEEKEAAAAEKRRAAAREAERKREAEAELKKKLAGLNDVREALRGAITELEKRRQAKTDAKDESK